MRSNFLGKEEVNAYLTDFLNRLSKFQDFPTVWCPVTPSGNDLLEALMDLIAEKKKELIDKIGILKIEVGRTSQSVKFSSRNPSKDIKGKNVLIFDSVVHTGSTMSQAVSQAARFGAKTVCTYGLVVKHGSNFIPTVWGLMIEDADRVFLLLPEIANQRLHAGQDKIRSLHIEMLNERHLQYRPVKSGLKSLDRTTWGDRYFDMKASEQSRHSYILKAGNNMIGYLTVHLGTNDYFIIDEIAVGERFRGQGYGSILIRFAHTLARQSDRLLVRLLAIKGEVPFYERNGYRNVPGRSISVDGEEYWLMERDIIRVLRCIFQ